MYEPRRTCLLVVIIVSTYTVLLVLRDLHTGPLIVSFILSSTRNSRDSLWCTQTDPFHVWIWTTTQHIIRSIATLILFQLDGRRLGRSWSWPSSSGLDPQLDQRGYGTASIYMQASSYLGRQDAGGSRGRLQIQFKFKQLAVSSYLLATGSS